MNKLFIITLVFGCVSCIDLGTSQKAGGPSEPGASKIKAAKVYNFNPRIQINGQVLLDKYPEMESFTAGTPGVSGVSMSVAELKARPMIILGAPGSDQRILATIRLKNGSVVKEVLK
jgi:hypothetical protein